MVDTAEAPTPIRPRPGNRKMRWVIAACTAVVIGISATVWFVNWRSSLESLVGYPTYGAEQPVPVGATRYYGGNLLSLRAERHPDDHGDVTVDVSAIRPIIEKNTAHAVISLQRCVLSDAGSGPLGQNAFATYQRCSALTPFSGGTVRLGHRAGDTDIVITVTPTRAGVAHILGVDVTYSSGLRHGTQHAGPEIRTTSA